MWASQNGGLGGERREAFSGLRKWGRRAQRETYRYRGSPDYFENLAYKKRKDFNRLVGCRPWKMPHAHLRPKRRTPNPKP